jgi:hypothetical protein
VSFSVFAVAAVLLAAVLALPAFLDGLAVLARPEPSLARIVIGALRDLRIALLSHFDLRW